MKVLFVSSATIRGLVPFIKVQGESLRDKGHSVDFFLIQKGGLKGYLNALGELRKLLKEKDYDVVHAHYSLIGTLAYIASFGLKVAVVCSFMGSDIHGTIKPSGQRSFSSLFVIINSFLIQFFLDFVIVKSEGLSKLLFIRKSKFLVLPNGVNTKVFKPEDKEQCRLKLGLPIDGYIWLFVGSPKVGIKNYALFEEIKSESEDSQNIFLAPYPVPHSELNTYYNAADAMLLCSFAEGSPNAVKECMAANTPVVSTAVGDVEFLFSNTSKGYLLAEANVESFLSRMDSIRNLTKEPDGRKSLIEHGLSSDKIANKLLEIYSQIIKQ